MKRRTAIATLLAGVLLAGCGSQAPDEPSFTSEPLTTITSDAGKLRIAVWTSPDQPPARGTLTLRLLVTEAASDKLVDGLTFDVIPEMPSMGHGTPVVPKTEASGGGVYLVSDVNLFMAGRWELRMTIGGSVSDVAIVTIDVR